MNCGTITCWPSKPAWWWQTCTRRRLSQQTQTVVEWLVPVHLTAVLRSNSLQSQWMHCSPAHRNTLRGSWAEHSRTRTKQCQPVNCYKSDHLRSHPAIYSIHFVVFFFLGLNFFKLPDKCLVHHLNTQHRSFPEIWLFRRKPYYRC